MEDHTGRVIRLGDKAIMDGGHTDDSPGTIISHGTRLVFRYDHNGDTVVVTDELCRSIEVIPQELELSEFFGSVHETAQEKGWHDEPRETGTWLALMHSELSEALEADRKDLVSEHIPEFSGLEEELADVIIRIGDFSTLMGLRVVEAMIAKAEFNKGREHKHGGKKY